MAVLAAGVAVALEAVIVYPIGTGLTSALVLTGVASAGFLCTASSAAVAYRRTDDTRNLFIALGAGMLGSHLLLFQALSIVFTFTDQTSIIGVPALGGRSSDVDVYLVLVGWAAA